MALRLADEPIDLAETEPGPLPYWLGRKKGVKRTRNRFRGHPCAGIAYRQHDVLPSRNLRMSGCIVLVQIRIAGLDCQRAPRWHRVPSVDRKIYQGVLKLVRVDKCPPQSGGERGLDGDPLPERASQKLTRSIY